MKKVLFLLLVTSISYGQALFDKGIKVTGGITTDNSATQVVVKSSNNVLNTIAKNDLIDVVIVNTTAELTAGIGNTSKLYATRDNTIIYRYNGTIYIPLGGDISSKEDISNKQNSLAADGTNTFYPTVTAVNTGLALKANLASPTFTGTPTLPTGTIATTQTAGNSTTAIATTAFATTALNLKANLASPTFTGVPLAPTASNGTNTTQIATTAFVNGAIGNGVALSANSVTIGSSSTNTDFPIPFVSSGSSFQNIYNNAPISINPSTNLLKLGGPMQITGATTATSFINSTAPATNALLANGTTLANPISGSGTTGYLPKFTSAGVIGNSIVQEVGSEIKVAGVVSSSIMGESFKAISTASPDARNIHIQNLGGDAYFGIENSTGSYFGLPAYTTNIYSPSNNVIITSPNVNISGSATSSQYKISALNTAPASATATGTTGEIRITAGFIYVCTATNTWVRTALATW